MKRFNKSISILVLLLLLSTVQGKISLAQTDYPDISGTWTATTPEGRFTILSVPNRDTGTGYYFLMLQPGEVEVEFGFKIGELLATLLELDGSCWQADERFRLPLWAGGGYYTGKTEYCFTTGNDDRLDFHTDDESAVFTDYPLERIADGIDAAGLWHCINPEMDFDIILYPDTDSDWEAVFVSGDYDAASEAEIEIGDVLYYGDNPPDSDGENGSAVIWGTIDSDELIWIPIVATLENSSILVFEINQGTELEQLEIRFERIY